MKKIRSAALLPLIAAAALSPASSLEAAQPTLSLTGAGKSQEFTVAELLGRGDVASIAIEDDVSYRHKMIYRAVPLLALLQGVVNGRFDTLEARAADGFVAQIPLQLVTQGAHGGAIAWLAVEDPAHPWPALPNRADSAGPFYVVWQYPQRSGISSEQWPFALVSLSLAESPWQRWPQLALPAGHAADAPARVGQKVFVTLCLPCHQLNGAGVAAVGPDLGRPMNATQYLTDRGLRALIRDPRTVRTWPEQRMTGFGPRTLPDNDLDALIAYLRAMTPQPAAHQDGKRP
jgi:mono/diheme cytochrome c family protein